VLHDVGEGEPQVLVHRLQLNKQGKECQKTIPSSRISSRTISSRELSRGGRWPIAPSYMSPNGGGGGVAGSWQ
jgi:hypothetical protein